MLSTINDFMKTVSKTTLYATVFSLVAPPVIVLLNWNEGLFGLTMIFLITLVCAQTLFMSWKNYKVLLEIAANKAKIDQIEKQILENRTA